MIDEIIYKILGSATNTPIFADIPPDDQGYPQVIYDIIHDSENYTLDENALSNYTRVQIDIRALSRAQARTVHDEVNAVLSGFNGVVDGVVIDLIKKVDRKTIVTKESQGLGIYRLVIDYIVHH